MRNISILAATIALVASPAFAESGKYQAQQAPQAGSYDVYGGKKRHHTDPDPNVLFEMKRQRNWRKGG
jgi:uncharacterized protein YdeI (BOF family)